jgi:hypothetical protein
MVELFVFGPALIGGAIIAVLGKRYLGREGLRSGAATLTAVVAGLAAGATYVVFVADWILYALIENGPDYDSASPYVEYRDATDPPVGFIIAAAYALLAAGLALAAGVAWRRGKQAEALVLGTLAFLGVALPALVPSLLPTTA